MELRERVEEIVIPRYVEVTQPAPPILAGVPAERLLRYGVPAEWVDEVHRVSEDGLLDLAGHLPAEAAEALLQLATGVTPPLPQLGDTETDPFDHPDAQRRFRMVRDADELAAALDYPWEKWTVFLHPAQREAVDRDYNGPARVSGSAGTGKTIVALHRAVYLARANPDARVLLTTFSDTLASALRQKLVILLSSEPRLADQIEVDSLHSVARRLYERNIGRPHLADPATIRQIMQTANQGAGQPFHLQFVMAEWENVIDAWQLTAWEAYRTVTRLGRRSRLSEGQRATLWAVFSSVWTDFQAQGLVTPAGLFSQLADHFAATGRSPYDFVVVDEAQDLSVAQLRFLGVLANGRPNSLFFTGDLGQRIFQQPFSWKALGVDVRGRSRTLRVNYRTSHQIRSQADRLLGPEVSDVDGNVDDRRGTVSAFNGPAPTILVLDSEETESNAVSGWLGERLAEGINPEEIGVFVRTNAQVKRAHAAVAAAGLTGTVLDDHVATANGHVSIGTMHLAKGLEFRAVVVMACDDEVIPLQERIETAGDEGELEEVYNTERHLLYVACTRARDHLLVTGVAPGSEFLDDLQM